MPPRFYVDAHTIISEVKDLRDLRRGDHGMSALNLVRCVHPTLDKIIGWLGSVELAYVYHHFTVMDDVSYIDEQGVPRTSSGEPVEIWEYSNTPRGFVAELKAAIGESWYRVPDAFVTCWLDKARPGTVPLTDYGDTPNLYVVREKLDQADRDRIHRNANYWTVNLKPYHAIFNNCEHSANLISYDKFQSPNVWFAVVWLVRSLLGGLSTFCLYDLAASCESGACAPLSTRMIVDYVFFFLFAVYPVAIQAIVTFAMCARSLKKHKKEGVIDRSEFWHLLSKELGRSIFTGGGAVSVTAMMPRVVIYTQFRYFWLACTVCMTVYLLVDVLYNIIAHAAMRLVLIPVFGKVWLIEGTEEPTSTKKKVA